MSTSRLMGQSPLRLVDRLLAAGQPRAYLVRDPESGMYAASHAVLRDVADFLDSDRHDCREHEAIFLEANFESGTLFAAFIHKTNRGQAQGGLRHSHYETLEDFLRDGLRLSLGMTRKNSTAGLWWGGGKGVIARITGDAHTNLDYRSSLYRSYGAFISSLRGCYVTAEDAGTNPRDMEEVYRATRFVTCVPPSFGGSGNPSQMTAGGVVCAMEAALQFRGMGDLEDKTIVMQGTGNVGSAMIPLLLDKGVARIVASEISSDRHTALLDAFADRPVEVRLAHWGNHDILAEPCDILAPSALGGVLSPKTIPSIQASIVCGPANNQLANEERDAALLLERGIDYVPDYIANRMGIVHCANEQYGHLSNDPMIMRHLDPDHIGSIQRTTLRVLEEARSLAVPPVVSANRLADELAKEQHPVWGARTRQIIDSLVAERWHEQR